MNICDACARACCTAAGIWDIKPQRRNRPLCRLCRDGLTVHQIGRRPLQQNTASHIRLTAAARSASSMRSAYKLTQSEMADHIAGAPSGVELRASAAAGRARAAGWHERGAATWHPRTAVPEAGLLRLCQQRCAQCTVPGVRQSSVHVPGKRNSYRCDRGGAVCLNIHGTAGDKPHALASPLC